MYRKKYLDISTEKLKKKGNTITCAKEYLKGGFDGVYVDQEWQVEIKCLNDGYFKLKGCINSCRWDMDEHSKHFYCDPHSNDKYVEEYAHLLKQSLKTYHFPAYQKNTYYGHVSDDYKEKYIMPKECELSLSEILTVFLLHL